MELLIDFEVAPPGTDLLDSNKDERESLIHTRIDGFDKALLALAMGTHPAYNALGRHVTNVRPIRWQPGFNSPLRNPKQIDYVIVRENPKTCMSELWLKQLLDAGLADHRSRIPHGG